MKILVVGGTADGRHLATKLHELGFDVIYSIAGQVGKATLPCQVITGGFSQFGGLESYITQNMITHLVDATDPFALKMSNKITAVGQLLSLTYIRFQQPEWTKRAQDRWIDVKQWSEVMDKIIDFNSILITAGQVSQSVLNQLSAQCKQVVIRTAMPLKAQLPNNALWIKAVGPFYLKQELDLLSYHQIDAIISKNSGGASTYAKIEAAASVNLPVLQFQRPTLAPAQREYSNLDDCVAYLSSLKIN